jgi:hypothetical protein
MTDFRALCAELVDALWEKLPFDAEIDALLERANAALTPQHHRLHPTPGIPITTVYRPGL